MTHRQLHCQEIPFPAILALPYAIAPPRYIYIFLMPQDYLSQEGRQGVGSDGGTGISGESIKKELSLLTTTLD